MFALLLDIRSSNIPIRLIWSDVRPGDPARTGNALGTDKKSREKCHIMRIRESIEAKGVVWQSFSTHEIVWGSPYLPAKACSDCPRTCSEGQT